MRIFLFSSCDPLPGGGMPPEYSSASPAPPGSRTSIRFSPRLAKLHTIYIFVDLCTPLVSTVPAAARPCMPQRPATLRFSR